MHTLLYKLNSNYVIQIRASEIDFWKEGFDRMRLKHMKRMYPPRVKMTIMYRDLESHKLLIKFLGCSTDCQLDTELALPLGMHCAESI